MSSRTREGIVFRGEQLLPRAWEAFATQGPVRTFNPGLLRDRDGWILAYRIVAADGLRRIGICRLDEGLGVVEGSAVAWSDHVRFRPDGSYPEVATRWFADPRIYRFGDRLFLYWNSGWHEPRNCQFLQEFDSTTLLPHGHPRELILAGERQKLEKNWTFFADATGTFRGIYSILPHRVLEFDLGGSGDIRCEDGASTTWSLSKYPPSHGGLRGGAPPVFADGRYWSFCHSVHDAPEGYRYLPAVYAFSPQLPFAPTQRPFRPLELLNPYGSTRTYPRLNPAVGEVIYPCGAARDGARWLISHGINDEYCAISVIDPAEVAATLEDV